ncbi:MAG: dihydrodipicolinate synthase family protein [Dehalococcoidales bacterium]
MKLSELKKKMKGVIIVNTTPFNRDGSLDLASLRTNLRWLLKRTAGKDFIFNPLGSTGEFYAMSDDECKTVIKTTVEEVNGKLPVFAGVGRPGTQETIKMCQYAESAGVDGVQVILPYYFIPTEAGAYQHYKQIAESIKIAVMVYNNPAPTGCLIKPALMAKIAKIDNVIACKENTPNLTQFVQMKKAVNPQDMTFFCGLGEEMYTNSAIIGCAGVVSSYANFIPDWTYSLYQAAETRDFTKMDATFEKMSPLVDFVAKMTCTTPGIGVSNPPPMYLPAVKAAMDIVGLKGGQPRLPLTGLTPAQKHELAEILKTLKISG